MRTRWLPAAALAVGALACSVEPALANGPPVGNSSGLEKLSPVLVQLLAVVLVLESALAALFQWRVYRMAFNARALKTPIMFVVGLLIVMVAQYNPMDQILSAVAGAATGDGQGRSALTGLLSAMILAGGSAGVFALFSRLGLRSPVTAVEQQAAKLNADQAWLSIRVKGAPEGSPIQIGIEELSAPDSEKMHYAFDHVGLPPFAGTIDPRDWWDRAAASFSADAQRFPSYGGRKVAAGKQYRIMATWQEGGRMEKFGVFRGQFAARAFIDLTVDLSDRP